MNKASGARGDLQEVPHARPPHRPGPRARREGGRVMSEYGYVEQPILGWLCGEPKAKYGEQAASAGRIATRRRCAATTARWRTRWSRSCWSQAILRINPRVKTEAQAKLAVAALRKTMSHPDKLTANRETLDLLRDGAKVVLDAGRRRDDGALHRVRSRPAGPERLHRHQPVPRAGREAVPRGHGAAGERHPARDRRVQELRRERQGLDARRCISSTATSARRR